MWTCLNNYGHYGHLFMCIYKVRLLIIYIDLLIYLLLTIFCYKIVSFISLTISKVVLQISCLYNIINIFMDIVAIYKKKLCLSRLPANNHLLTNLLLHD